MSDQQFPNLPDEPAAETRRAQPTALQPPVRPSGAKASSDGTSPIPAGAGHARAHPPAAARQRLSRRDDALYLPLWSVALMLVIVALISFGIVALVISLGAPSAPPATPQLVILTAQPPPSATPPALPTVDVPTAAGSADASFALEGPTLVVPQLSPTPQPVAIGALVQINLPGNEVNVRSGPGTQNQRLFGAIHGRQFRVVGGPQSVDSFLWWEIEDVIDPSQRGWAAGQYLEVVPQS